MDVLKIENLSKQFGDHVVINDLSFSVPEHSVFGFLGQNGAGKTTTMKIILGLLKATSGKITVCGEVVNYGETKTNRFIGYLPDVPEFYSYMTPKEYLSLCGQITGLTTIQIKHKSSELLELVGLPNINRRIGGFSRGMKQRLGIAQALLNEPKLLICDEPTSALDPLGRKEILDILSVAKAKTTVVFSTHILSDAERICDRIAVLHNGKLALSGSLSEVKESRRHDSICLEFGSNKDAENMVEEIKKISLVKDIKKMENVLTINVANLKEAGKIIIDLISQNRIFITRYEVLEPSLESLFMEVVK